MREVGNEAMVALLDALADAVAEKVVDRLRAGSVQGWIDQSASSLGRRKHIAAVRKRVRAGDTQAVQLGRRYLLSKEAHDAEMRAAGEQSDGASAEERIANELGLRLVGGGK